ncbi:MAG: TonB family protein [Caulobacterales bacterium]
MSRVLFLSVERDAAAIAPLAEVFARAKFSVGIASPDAPPPVHDGAWVIVWSQSAIRSRTFLEAAHVVASGGRSVMACLIPPPPAGSFPTAMFDLSLWDGDPEDPSIDPLFFHIEKLTRDLRLGQTHLQQGTGRAAPAPRPAGSALPYGRPREAGAAGPTRPPEPPAREVPTASAPPLPASPPAPVFKPPPEYAPRSVSPPAAPGINPITTVRVVPMVPASPSGQVQAPRLEAMQQTQHVPYASAAPQAQARATPAVPDYAAPEAEPMPEPIPARPRRASVAARPKKRGGFMLSAMLASAMVVGAVVLLSRVNTPAPAEDEPLATAEQLPTGVTATALDEALITAEPRAESEPAEVRRPEVPRAVGGTTTAPTPAEVAALSNTTMRSIAPLPLPLAPAASDAVNASARGLSEAVRPVSAPELRAGEIVWVNRINPERLAAAYPPRALSSGVGGRVVLNCTILIDGLVRCAVASETPAGQGFGAAAMRAAAGMRVSPQLDNGATSQGVTTQVPVVFQTR